MKQLFSFLLLLGYLPVHCQPTRHIVMQEEGVENAYPRYSKNGIDILYQSNRSGKWQLFTYQGRTRTSLPVTRDTFNNNFPDWSPDNKWIAFVSDRDGNEELYLVKIDGTGLKRLTGDPHRDIHPYFSPDGKYLLFNSDRGNGSLDIYRLTLSTLKVERLTNTADNETCARYAPDMKSIVYLRNNHTTDDIFLFSLITGLSENLTHTPFSTDGWPMFSKDRKWVYFSSMESGTYCIYRIHPNGSGKERLTLAAKGEEHARACISPDGKTLLYNLRTNGRIDIVEMKMPR